MCGVPVPVMARAAFGAGPVAYGQVFDTDVLVATTVTRLAGREEPVHLDERVALVLQHRLECGPTAVGYRF